MSEAELRGCDEAFASGEGAVEPCSEQTGSSMELLERLRELEAENSALALANESQREAYERCLDEVANHVVQALLNQKDLREECIKLKMRVFDLERQNRSLTELFAQKLHPQTGPPPQVPVVCVPELSTHTHTHSTALGSEGSVQLLTSHSKVELKGHGERTPNGSALSPASSSSSVDASMSPFLQKKAHILEVLRRLEESDPLRLRPSACLLLPQPHAGLGQALASVEAGFSAARRSARCCRHSSSGGEVQVQGAPPPQTAPPPPAEGPGTEPSPDPAPLLLLPSAENGEEPRSSHAHQDERPSSELPLRGGGAEPLHSSAPPPLTPPCGATPNQQLFSGLFFSSNEASVSRKVAVESYSPAPAPNRLGPALAEPPAPPARLQDPLQERRRRRLRGAPLARPGAQRRPPPPAPTPAAAEERDGTPEPYPPPAAPTHSAPTSPPPEPEGHARSSPPPPARGEAAAYSSHSAPKLRTGVATAATRVPQRGAPHYENVRPSDGTARYLPSDSAPGEVAVDDAPPQRGEEPPPLSPAPSHHHQHTVSDPDTDSPAACWLQPRQTFSLPSSSSSSSSSASSAFAGHIRAHRHPGGGAPRRGEPGSSSSSAPRRGPGGGRAQSDLSHLPFKERLAALGRPRGGEEPHCIVGKPPGGERSRSGSGGPEQRAQKHSDSPDGKLGPRSVLPAPPRAEEPLPPRALAGKAEGPKIKMGVSSSTGAPAAEPPPATVRSYGKSPVAQGNHGKTVPPSSPQQSSPSSKPPPSRPPPSSRAGQASSSYPRGAQLQRPPPPPSARPPEEQRGGGGNKLTASGQRRTAFAPAEPLPPPPPLPPRTPAAKKPFSAAGPPPPGPQSAIEQKVMRGIEENMLKLQDRGPPPAPEPQKHRAANGIASWFGLRRSKLPALSGGRKPDATPKPKMAASAAAAAGPPRKVVESLNISKLMEKAEDLRKALEEERAYVNGVGVAMQRAAGGRGGRSCEVGMDPSGTQGQLALVYRGVTTDTFMQQLLNRVEERGGASFGVAHRRLSFDSKRSRPVFNVRNGMSHNKSGEEVDMGSDVVSKDDVTSDESLADSISSQHFTGSGASMRTLDSGIGTFPMPDCAGGGAAGKSAPRGRAPGETGFAGAQGKHGGVTKVPRSKASRVPERELSSLDEVCPSVLYGSGTDGKAPSMHLASTIHEDVDAYGAHVQTPPPKHWTFPSLREGRGSARGGAGGVFLDGPGELGGQGGPPSRSVKQVPPQGTSPPADPTSCPEPPPETGLSRRGKGRTPRPPEVGGDREDRRDRGGDGGDGGLELVRERPEDILSPGRAPPALETPESLSDSLYDSLSSCGSQG